MPSSCRKLWLISGLRINIYHCMKSPMTHHSSKVIHKRVCPISCTTTWVSTWLYWYHISIACKTWLSQQSMCLIITVIGVPTNNKNQGTIYNEVIMCYRVLQSSLTWCPVTWVHYWNHTSIPLYNHLHDWSLGHVSYTLPSIPRLGRASNGDHSRSLATMWQQPVIASRAYSQHRIVPRCL